MPADCILAAGSNSKQVIDEIRTSTNDVSNTLFNRYSKSLQKAVNNVFGQTAYGDDNYAVQQQLLANVSRFAAHKAYLVTESVRRQVADADGVARSEKDFYTYAQRVINTANRYQAAEYHAAISRSRTARQWQEFAADPDVPNLKWTPSRAAHPREAHKQFYGLVLPKKHPFWMQNQPGNVWGCRCDWEETFDNASAKVPAGTPAAQGLEGNPAITGEIFTENSSYFQETGRRAEKQINKAYIALTRGDIMDNIKKLYGKKTQVTIEGNAVNVEYTKRTKKHIANDNLGSETYLKNQITANLDKYLETGRLVARLENTKEDKKKGVETYYYFEIILPDGKPAFLHVEKWLNGRYNLYAITNKLNKKVNYYSDRPKGTGYKD
jgi:hypothetical protein